MNMIHTVCSERLILVNGCPENLASAVTRLVLPTPGEPSRRMGRVNCMARTNRKQFSDVVFDVNEYVPVELNCANGPVINGKKHH